MFTRHRALALALTGSLFLAACNGVARKAYAPSSSQPLRTVGLLTVPKTEGYGLLQLGFQPAMMFGAVGGLVAAIGDTYKASVVEEAFRQRAFDPAGELEKELERAIRGAGYEVVRVTPTIRGKGGFVESYAALTPRADLYLDATIAGLGFESVSASSPWQPTLTVLVRLAEGRTGEIVYSDHLMIGTGNVLTDVKHLSSDSQYSFASYTEIRDRVDFAAEGFRYELATVANEVGRSIGRGSVTAVAETPAPVTAVVASAPAAAPAPVTAVVASAPAPAPPAIASPPPPPAGPAARTTLGRCELPTARRMKQDGATESEIVSACRATVEETRALLGQV